MGKIITVEPAVEPVTYEEALSHLKISSFDEENDLLIQTKLEGLIKAVRKNIEEIYGRALITQTWQVFLDYFPCENFITLPLPPLQTITSITYTDYLGVPTVFDPSNYIQDIVSEPGQIVLTYLNTWPVFTPQSVNAVMIEMICGYGDTAEDVPEPIKQGMLIAIADLWDNPGDLSERPINSIKAADRLLSQYRIW